MARGQLKKLEICNLRGSTEPFVLEFKQRLTLIYGENGTGKSTISDAFEFIGKGAIGSIEGRGLGNTITYWPSLGKDRADVSVTLETDQGQCCAHLGRSGAFVDEVEYQPKVEILRRSQILSLIEAQPGKRYSAISRFIDVSGVEESEATLRKLIKSLEQDSDRAIARIQENLQTIENFHKVAEVMHQAPVEWAEEQVLRDIQSFDDEIAALKSLNYLYAELAQAFSKLENVREDLHKAQASEKEAESSLNAILTTISEDSSDLLALLKAAQQLFIKHSRPESCPLCDSTENATDLALRTTARIEQLSTLSTASEAHSQAQYRQQQAQRRVEEAQREFEAAALKIEDWSQLPLVTETLPLPVPREAQAFKIWKTQAEPLLPQWHEQEQKLQDSKKFFATLKKSLKVYHDNLLEEQELEKLIPKLKQALKIAEEERHRFVDDVLASISDDVGRLYESIHPGEGLNKISLQLNPKKRASLDIGSEFLGRKDIPPQAYFSESHLDTLGFCIFLALANRDCPQDKILVLDDVLASVDEPHVERLINLLHTETQKFLHCVITTHYRPWKYKLKWGWLQKGQCNFVELTHWSSVKGISCTRSTPDVERLRELLSETPPDAQLVCAKAGFILEATLDFLTSHYECKVPRRADNRYTLGDLLPAIDKKLRKALKVEILDGYDQAGDPIYQSKSLEDIIVELNRIAQARNVFGAHFNALSFELLESDALRFGQIVLELVESLTCPEYGWPRNKKSGSYSATSGETRRLHPFCRPG